MALNKKAARPGGHENTNRAREYRVCSCLSRNIVKKIFCLRKIPRRPANQFFESNDG